MSDKKKPLISIITSCWNREKYLKILAYSLKKQTFKNFEWIIGNDGSLDNTDKLIRSLAKKVNFKIIYINSDVRIGKSKIVNLMLEKISGKYMIECDSDDYFLPDALEKLINLANLIPTHNQNKYIGVCAQNIDTNGVSQTYKKNIPSDNACIKWEELKKKIDGDASILAFSRNFKKKRYLEVDFLITESSLLEEVFKGKFFILTKKIVKIMDRNATNSVSFGNKMQFTRASAYCLAKLESKKKFNKKDFVSKIKTIVYYWRYTLHGDINFQKAIKMFKPIKENYLYCFLILFSYLIYLIDIFLNKVEKTHILFEKNKKIAQIKFEILN